MNNDKTISVAMATYNGEKYLKEQLDSILSQLKDDDELVISYDTSDDTTETIISDYSQRYKQVKVYIDPGKGVFSNFENAISMSNGDYIFISDQDDIWVDGKRDEIIKVFSNHNADMVIHNAIHVNENGTPISEDFFSTHNIKNGIIRNFARPRYSGCCIAFTKEMKGIILPIPKDVGAYDHWIGMVGELFGQVYFDNRVFLKHRLHGDNVTVSTRRLSTIIHVRWRLLMHLLALKRTRKLK